MFQSWNHRAIKLWSSLRENSTFSEASTLRKYGYRQHALYSVTSYLATCYSKKTSEKYLSFLTFACLYCWRGHAKTMRLTMDWYRFLRKWTSQKAPTTFGKNNANLYLSYILKPNYYLLEKMIILQVNRKIHLLNRPKIITRNRLEFLIANLQSN